MLTNEGEVAVEDLKIGDLALTASGRHRSVTWIGHRTLDPTLHPEPKSVRPLLVSAGGFGEDLRTDSRLLGICAKRLQIDGEDVDLGNELPAIGWQSAEHAPRRC